MWAFSSLRTALELQGEQAGKDSYCKIFGGSA
jgi:hypothetical protein